jgi:hypothetical protein
MVGFDDVIHEQTGYLVEDHAPKDGDGDHENQEIMEEVFPKELRSLNRQF